MVYSSDNFRNVFTAVFPICFHIVLWFSHWNLQVMPCVMTPCPNSPLSIPPLRGCARLRVDLLWSKRPGSWIDAKPGGCDIALSGSSASCWRRTYWLWILINHDGYSLFIIYHHQYSSIHCVLNVGNPLLGISSTSNRPCLLKELWSKAKVIDFKWWLTLIKNKGRFLMIMTYDYEQW